MSGCILVLHDPNLNLLGQREPEVYGDTALAEIDEMCRAEASTSRWNAGRATARASWWAGCAGRFRRSGLERRCPQPYFHRLLAALRSLNKPLIVVHLSNIYRRETFRQHSHVSLAADGVICGLGPRGCLLALDALAAILEEGG